MLNKAIIMGRLCADPEFKLTSNGVANCRFRVAVNRQYADKQTGERQADFISVTCWRQTAEFVNKYFHKGNMIIIEGSLRNNDWTDQSGVKHYSMVVQADNVSFGESKQSSQSAQNNPQQAATPTPQTYQPSPQVPSQPSHNTSQSVPVQEQFPGYYENYADRPPANQTQHTYANDVQRSQQMPDIGDLGDFEEIIGDGEPPF
ncbi:MAG: single-stranded DNA-binding protein [Ruminococcus sp.]|nr:single-stranded DNA-binding protein [Ruminococcus sp.]